MRNYFSIAGSPLFRGTYHGRNDKAYAYLWPFSRAVTATLDLYGNSTSYRGAVADRLKGLSAYWDGAASPPGYDASVLPPYGGGADKYYDDNAWAGLALERAYRMTGDSVALAQAERVFTFAWSGWSASAVCAGPAATGGIFWKQQIAVEQNHDRNTVSNAPNAELGLRLYQDTGNQTYLENASAIYDWVNTYLRDPGDGLYWDHVGPDETGACTLEKTKWSYNQGTMIGAGVILYQITGQQQYLDQAKSIATAALALYGCSSGCTGTSPIIGHGPAFNATFFRNLLLLSSVDTTNPSYREAMQSYADLIWNDTTIRKTTLRGTLFYFHQGYVDLLDQAAMVEIYAGLAWDPSKLGLIV